MYYHYKESLSQRMRFNEVLMTFLPFGQSGSAVVEAADILLKCLTTEKLVTITTMI